MTHKSKLKLEARTRQARFGGPYAAQLNQLRATGLPRELNVRAHAERILVIAKRRRAAYSAWTESICKRDGTEAAVILMGKLPPNQEDPTHPTYIAQENEGERLFRALRSLPEDVLRKIQIVMYMGRDDDDYDGLGRLLRGEMHLARAATVSGKVPLDEYLEAGLRLVDERGVDLQAALRDD